MSTIVQETLAKAFYTMSLNLEPPPLRPWLFRIAHNAALYFARYEKENVSLRVVRLEGRLALAAFVAGAERASYFILLAWKGDRLSAIRDFRYVPYIAAEAEFEPCEPSREGRVFRSSRAT